MLPQASLAGHSIAALLPAAGSGVRMGSAVAKPFLAIEGREILAYTLEVFERCAAIDEICVMVAEPYRLWCQQAIIERYGFRKVRRLVAGGATRQESVWRGLLQVSPQTDLVVIHDGVRPFVTLEVLEATLERAATMGAAIAAIPVKDTLKRVSAAGEVEATISREHLWRVQTPQAFQRSLLLAAFRHAWGRGLWATDEAGLIEAYGHPVAIVPGLETNIKITTPDDLLFCESLVRHHE